MLKTRAISAEKRPQVGFGRRKLAFAALLAFLLFAALSATAQRAAADTGMPDSSAIEATIDATSPASPVSTPVAQDAATGQTANAGATAVEPQQSNTIEAAPTDSAGAIDASQGNEAAVAGAAANDASTNQAAGDASTADGEPSESDQQAATDQAANAAAAAVEPQQTNVVIIIRVNSPGDDVVSQTNVVSVVGAAANQGSTAQQQGSTTQDPAPAGAPASGTSDPTQSQPAGGPTPPADGRPQPSRAVPQPAQSAHAAQQLVQPADAVQGQRPQGARALSILGSTAGSNASPPAPEQTSKLGANSVPGADDSVAEAATVTAGPTGLSSREAARGVPADHTIGNVNRQHLDGRLGALLNRIARWPGNTGNALRSAATVDRAEGGWNLGLTTLVTLLVGLVGWAVLTLVPSLRRLPRTRIGG
jgi:hypothetical protein